jgi:hypothetical protein
LAHGVSVSGSGLVLAAGGLFGALTWQSNEEQDCLHVNLGMSPTMIANDRVLRSNLKLKHLQLLVALDQFRHLGRASEFLSLTQPVRRPARPRAGARPAIA